MSVCIYVCPITKIPSSLIQLSCAIIWYRKAFDFHFLPKKINDKKLRKTSWSSLHGISKDTFIYIIKETTSELSSLLPPHRTTSNHNSIPSPHNTSYLLYQKPPTHPPLHPTPPPLHPPQPPLHPPPPAPHPPSNKSAMSLHFQSFIITCRGGGKGSGGKGEGGRKGREGE